MFNMFPLVDERIRLEAELEQYGTERNLITTKGGITNRPFTGAARRAGRRLLYVLSSRLSSVSRTTTTSVTTTKRKERGADNTTHCEAKTVKNILFL